MSTPNPRVSVIFVSYNTADLITDAIDSLLDQTLPPAEIVVADNASTDGSFALLSERYGDRHDVVVFETGGNFGFARGVNVAVARSSGELIMLANGDARFESDCIEHLVDAWRAHPESRLFGGKVLFPDGRINPTTARPLASLWALACHGLLLGYAFPGHRWFDPEAIPGWDRETPRTVGMLSGVMLLVERQFFDDLGGFDEDFWLYGEDADFSHRAGQRGATPRYVPDAVATHAPGSSSADSAAKIAWMRRGEITYLRKHWRGAKLALALTLFWLGSFLRAAAHRVRPREGDTDWVGVFAMRKQWLAGFPPGPHDGPPPA